ncbi:MAG: hypothetical protein ABIJ09_00310 [Pseudomonadota bacterium]
MFTALHLVLLASLPRIVVEPGATCVDQAGLLQALGEQLDSTDPALELLELHLDEHPGPDADILLLNLELRQDDGELLLSRSLRARRADCPELPTLVATVVARQLAQLPRERWSRRRPVAPAAPASARTRPGSTTASTWQLRSGLGLGAGLGVAAPAGAVQLQLLDDVGLLSDWRLATVLAGTAGWYPLGPGEVQVLTLRVGAGPAWDLPLATITLSPRLLLVAGCSVASGTGFARNQTSVLPLLLLSPALLVHTHRGLYASLGLEIPLVNTRYRVLNLDTGYQEPWLRVVASLGIMLDVVGP